MDWHMLANGTAQAVKHDHDVRTRKTRHYAQGV